MKKILVSSLVLIVILIPILLVLTNKQTVKTNKLTVDNKEYPADWFAMQRIYPNTQINDSPYKTVLV